MRNKLIILGISTLVIVLVMTMSVSAAVSEVYYKDDVEAELFGPEPYLPFYDPPKIVNFDYIFSLTYALQSWLPANINNDVNDLNGGESQDAGSAIEVDNADGAVNFGSVEAEEVDNGSAQFDCPDGCICKYIDGAWRVACPPSIDEDCTLCGATSVELEDQVQSQDAGTAIPMGDDIATGEVSGEAQDAGSAIPMGDNDDDDATGKVDSGEAQDAGSAIPKDDGIQITLIDAEPESLEGGPAEEVPPITPP